MIEYRVLEPNEFDRLAPIFSPRGLPLPDPLIERVGVAEENSKIVGMSILRLLPLIDGLWADKQYRGGRIDYAKLIGVAEQPLRDIPNSRCYAFITNSHIRKIAENLNYKPLRWQVFEKEFTCR